MPTHQNSLKILKKLGEGCMNGGCFFFSSHPSQNLPRLPVPPLKQTLDRYLRMVRVIATETDFKETERSDYEVYLQLALDLQAVGSHGEKLQKLLQNRAEAKENWLADWWLKCAYLDFRSPLPVHGSPGMAFGRRNFTDVQDQLNYAGKLVYSFVAVHDKICKHDIATDTAWDGSPLEMIQYYQIFGTTRLPMRNSDQLRLGCEQKEKSRHIIVIHNGHIFKLKVYDQNSNPLPAGAIAHLLMEIIDKSQVPVANPVGILTSEHRDSWADNFSQLYGDAWNRRLLDIIESSLFALCLDKSCESDNKSEVIEHASQFCHGGGTKKNSRNRWFDKTLQICVNENGNSGITFEHSPSDGPPIATIVDIAMKLERKQNLDTNGTAVEWELPELLQFRVSDNMKQQIQAAEEKVNALAADFDFHFLHFGHFGKAFKKALKISPDSFIQIALQLAYWKMHKELGPQYETGMTRRFRLGRTETIRLPTPESAEFVQSFYESDVPSGTKIVRLIFAIQSHQEYAKAAMNGNGVDRHLLGLKLIALENGLEVPELLNHKTYAQMNSLKLSTSQVPNEHVTGIAFGQIVPDGYGIFYNPQHADITFSISSSNSCSTTSAEKFAESLENCKLDMYKLLKSEN